MPNSYFVVIGLCILATIVLLSLLAHMFRKAGPNEALTVYGFRGPRVIKGHGTVIFPEGSRTLDGNLQPALPGLGLVIAKTLAPVVPMRIFGAHAAFPRGGRPRIFRPITLVVGEPMRFSQADLAGHGRELYQRLSEAVMERIAAIEYE